MNIEKLVLPANPYPRAFIASACKTAFSKDQVNMLLNVRIPLNILSVMLSLVYKPNVFCVAFTFFICDLNKGINFNAIAKTSDNFGIIFPNK